MCRGCGCGCDHMSDVFEQWAGTWFGDWEPIDEPVEVHATFFLPRPRKPRLDYAATGLDLGGRRPPWDAQW